MKYIKQLDSVRAIAVIMVIICHWFEPNNLLTDGRLGRLGAYGVDTFFVLSGFLITGILIKAREDAGQAESKAHVFKNFYIRRALRIFPIFYLVVFLLFAFSFFVQDISRKELLYSATYTINFLFHKARYWSGYTTHFWSLAVEEQFYLVWPVLMLFTKKKWLPLVIAGFILIGSLSQLRDNNEFGYLSTNACFDAFGLGALFAWMRQYKPAGIALLLKIVRVLAIVSIIILIYEFYTDTLLKFPNRTLHSVVALWVVISLVLFSGEGGKNIFARFFENRVLMFIGRISYGVYLYHLYVPLTTNYILNKIFGINILGVGVASGNGWFLLANFLILIAVAWVSWIMIEKPILKLKQFFVYRERQPQLKAA